jgi:CRP/FNR family transcriptional regulator, cyclic AMP receptor protein
MTMSIAGRQTGTRNSRRRARVKAESWAFTGAALEQYRKIARMVAHPSGSVVFKEGDPANGIFLVCEGRVKLFATEPGHTMILKIARPGDVLGLSAMLNNLPHEVTAQTLVPCTFKHIGQEFFLSFLEAYAEAGYITALTLAKEHREVFFGTRRLALSPSAAARIAQVLIGFARLDSTGGAAPCFPLELTHAELAGLAGTSRETVTRLLNQFERSGIISRDNSMITIARLSQLEQLAH